MSDVFFAGPGTSPDWAGFLGYLRGMRDANKPLKFQHQTTDKTLMDPITVAANLALATADQRHLLRAEQTVRDLRRLVQEHLDADDVNNERGDVVRSGDGAHTLGLFIGRTRAGTVYVTWANGTYASVVQEWAHGCEVFDARNPR